MPEPGADSGYPISHFAAMHPAEVIDLSSEQHLLKVARNTVQVRLRREESSFPIEES